jgi:hypothetical protein
MPADHKKLPSVHFCEQKGNKISEFERGGINTHRGPEDFKKSVEFLIEWVLFRFTRVR